MGIFNMDSGFARFMNRVIDVLELNILWIIFSLPIFTIGASTCAAYYVTLKLLCDDEVTLNNTAKLFFKAFKDNFKQGTIRWLITLPCIVGCFFMWRAILLNGDVNIILKIGAAILTLIAIIINLYTYPLLARYDNTIKKSIMNSIVISMLYIARTIIVAVVVAVEMAVAFTAVRWNIWIIIPVALIIPELVVFTISMFSKRVLLDSEKNGGSIIPPAVQIQQEIDEKETDEK